MKLNDLKPLGAVVPSLKEIEKVSALLYEHEGPSWLRDEQFPHLYLNEYGNVFKADKKYTAYIVPELIVEEDLADTYFINIGDNYSGYVSGGHRILLLQTINNIRYNYPEPAYEYSYIKDAVDYWYNNFISEYGDKDIQLSI